MELKYACIKDGTVQNIIVMDSTAEPALVNMLKQDLGYSEIVPVGNNFVDMGYLWNGAEFSKPEPVEPLNSL